MIICPKCGQKMNKVMHFEYGKHTQFFQCNNCYFKTAEKRINNLNKGVSFEKIKKSNFIF